MKRNYFVQATNKENGYVWFFSGNRKNYHGQWALNVDDAKLYNEKEVMLQLEAVQKASDEVNFDFTVSNLDDYKRAA